MARFGHELETAYAAAQAAREQVLALRHRDLDDSQQRARRKTLVALREATGEHLGPFESPVIVAYTATVQALSHLDRLERGLDHDRRQLVIDAREQLHLAEDVLEEPYRLGG